MSIPRLFASPVSTVNKVDISVKNRSVRDINYKFSDPYDFSELEQSEAQLIIDEEEISRWKTILINLIKSTLSSGCDVVSRATLLNNINKTIIEATFVPSLNQNPSRIYLPLGLKSFILEAKKHQVNPLNEQLDIIIENIAETSNYLILKLIVLLSHELGHYCSFINGLHDQDLKQGLSLVHSANQETIFEKYTYRVFLEEVTAWQFAQQKLSYLNFNDWKFFNEIKYNSLKAYYRLLKLNKVSVGVYCKLSLLNLDLQLLDVT